MNTNVTLMVFTDLDGTLIDHDTYRWDAAEQALLALGETGSAVILASSKTAVEISRLRHALGFDQWPAIVENGAGLLPSHVMQVTDHAQYLEIRNVLQGLPHSLRGLFHGFGDETVEGVVRMTGLAHADAALAKQRAFSEPGIWNGTEAQKEGFLQHLSGLGITAQQGGRFLTLSFGRNKSDQMRSVIQTYTPQHTIALGDAPNDVQMLETADYGVVIANPHRAALAPLKGEDDGRIIRTQAAGPRGWNIAVLDFIKKFEIQRTKTNG
ncbi:HAD-IIB family hydrolase [Parasphingorhabdus sp.]|uniref:HAD-IIB family hydrolase n=1 Tax=Parasphingorhabdus sp. TaxID=2709688 RepID=UPI0032983870